MDKKSTAGGYPSPYNPAVAGTKSVDQPKLSNEEVMERSFDLMRLVQISRVRESSHPQFDGMNPALLLFDFP